MAHVVPRIVATAFAARPHAGGALLPLLESCRSPWPVQAFFSTFRACGSALLPRRPQSQPHPGPQADLLAQPAKQLLAAARQPAPRGPPLRRHPWDPLYRPMETKFLLSAFASVSLAPKASWAPSQAYSWGLMQSRPVHALAPQNSRITATSRRGSAPLRSLSTIFAASRCCCYCCLDGAVGNGSGTDCGFSGGSGICSVLRPARGANDAATAPSACRRTGGAGDAAASAACRPSPGSATHTCSSSTFVRGRGGDGSSRNSSHPRARENVCSGFRGPDDAGGDAGLCQARYRASGRSSRLIRPSRGALMGSPWDRAFGSRGAAGGVLGDGGAAGSVFDFREFSVGPSSSGGGGGGSGGGAVMLEEAGERKALRRAAAREGKPVEPQRGRFVDWAQLLVRGGRGGAGRVSFEPVGRGQHLAATGGSGGAGGDVIIRANGSTTSLYGILPVVVAGAGGAGGASGRTGGRGSDRMVDVPVGTTLRVWPAAATSTTAAEGEAAADGGLSDADGDGEDGSAGTDGDGDEKYTDDSYEDDLTDEFGAGEVDDAEEDATCGAPEGSTSTNTNSSSSSSSSSDPRFTGPPVLQLDLTRPGQAVVVARGGAGGRGNGAYLTLSSRPASRDSEAGAPGEEFWVRLETRILADVGFVGLPNAGKSTLLAAITAARAKVGSYAFTTLRPQLGTILYGDGARLITADIPGLVQGAHANRGRGNSFLRHIERCRCMAFILDLSGGTSSSSNSSSGVSNSSDSRSVTAADRTAVPAACAGEGPAPGGGTGGGNYDYDDGEAAAKAAVGSVPLPPAEQLRVLQEELRLFNPALLAAPAVVVANKLDRCADPRVALRALMAATSLPIVPVAAAHGVGLTRLKEALRAIAPTQATRGSASALA